MEKNKDLIFKPTYSPKGFLIEYKKINKNFWMQMLLRLLAFILDYSIVIVIWAIMYFSLMKGNKYIPFIIPLLYCAIYQTIVPMCTKGRTMGLALARLRIVHKSGFYSSMSNYYFRGMLSVFYAIPIIGQILMISAILSSFLTRGVTLIGGLSQTIIISTKTYEKLQKMQLELKEESEGK